MPGVMGGCLAAAAAPLAAWWPMVPIIAYSLIIPSPNVSIGTITAQLVPPDMLGRIGSLLTLASFGLQPIGPLIGGILAGAIGGGATLLCVGIGLVITAVVAAGSRTLRRFRTSTGSAI